MAQQSSSTTERSTREEMAQAWPFYIIVSLVMIGGYVNAITSDPSLRQPARLALLTVLLLAHGGLYWTSPYLLLNRRRLVVFCVVQGTLAFAIGMIAQGHWLVMGLYPALIGLVTAAFWPNVRVSILAGSLCFSLMALNLIITWGFQEFLQLLPFVGLMLAFVVIYVLLFVRQVEARERAQALLHELETAHRQLQAYADQVEELTLGRERERMAREFHDTLAQGLAGLILQLEAADSYLENDNPVRAQEIVQQAMQRARTTLDEARRAIQALRPSALERGSLIDALGQAIDQFGATTSVRTTFEVDTRPPGVSQEAAQDILRIVQESLSNVAHHAHADHVLVQLAERDGGLHLVVQDDGVGFDLAEGLERPSCFGLAGMQERASRLGGTLRVESAPEEGTKVTLEIGKGER